MWLLGGLSDRDEPPAGSEGVGGGVEHRVLVVDPVEHGVGEHRVERRLDPERPGVAPAELPVGV